MHAHFQALNHLTDGIGFNFANKTIYGVQMLDNIRFHGLMMEEIFSKRNRMAGDGTLAKALFYDIVRMLRVLMAISLVATANCFNSIVHIIASLVFHSFSSQRRQDSQCW